MRRLAILIVVFLLPLHAFAEARKYAILSLLGDKLLIVQREMSTGSRVDTNTRQGVDLPDASIDRAVLQAVDEGLRKADPTSETVFLSIRDPRIYALQKQMLEGSGDTGILLSELRSTLGEVRATHLVLATKYRHEAMLRLADGHVGSGFLEGLGFYIDHAYRTINRDSGESAEGFLGTFAYFSLTLVELPRWKIAGETRVIASHVVSTARSASGHPWDAMSAADKTSSLQQLIRQETLDAFPTLMEHRAR